MKERYNLLFAIKELACERAFEEYKANLDPNISENRKARAFLAHFSHILPYKLPCFIKGQEMPYMEYLEKCVLHHK